MKKIEYGQLSKRSDRIGYSWNFYRAESEKGFDDNLGLLDVPNMLGEQGWVLAIQESNNEKNGEKEYILYKELSNENE